MSPVAPWEWDFANGLGDAVLLLALLGAYQVRCWWTGRRRGAR